MFLIDKTYLHPVYGTIKSPKFPPSSPKTLTLAIEKINNLHTFLTAYDMPLTTTQITSIKAACQSGLTRKNLPTVLGEICTYFLDDAQRELFKRQEIAKWGSYPQQKAIFSHVLDLLKLHSIHLVGDEITSLETFIKDLPPPTTSEELDRTYDKIIDNAKELVAADCSPYLSEEDYYLVTSDDV